MGSSVSTKLTCPKDYDNNKFNMILKLYDRLDSNGDQVIETLELKDIAKLHINNRKTEINKLKEKEVKDYEYNLNQEKNIEKINNSHICRDVSLINQFNKLENMDEATQCQTFLNVVSNDGKHIEFWKFFDYMKTRTNDISYEV